MDAESRLQELLPLWSWLPSFRAVAETQHLPSAAVLCGTGTSSLSRSVAMLERAVGQPLFERCGRRLTLNSAGKILLAAVRNGMRRIDDGLAELRGDQMRGPLSVGSSGAGTTALVAPAIEQLRVRHPELLPRLITHPTAETAEALLSGRLDIAFQEAPVQRSGLVTHGVGSLTRSVYCGRRHALFESAEVTANDVEAADFVAPPTDAEGNTPDGWPPQRARRVVLITDQLRVGLELCVDQPLLAVLPDVLAATRAGALRRLAEVPIDPSPVFAIHREVLGPRPSAAAQLAQLISGSRAPATAPSSRR